MSATAARPPRLPPPPPRGDGLRLRERGTLLLRHPGCALAYVEGHAARRVLARRPAAITRGLRARDAAVDVEMWSFSSQHDLPEQLASIASFLRHAGRPRCWTVVSDGTHDAPARALLEAVDPAVRVVAWDAVAAPGLPPAVRRFAEVHPLGKKLAVMASLPVERVAMMVDSDVLFLPGAATLSDDLGAGVPRYQLDCYDVLADAVVPDDAREDPTNTGIVVLPHQLPWDAAFAALDAALPQDGDVPGAWLEQGTVHLAMRSGRAVPLAPERYVISGADVLRHGELPLPSQAVLRHYAGPTRYMFWRRVAAGLARRSRGR